ncbi:putative alpha-1,2-mannosidase [Saccharicrinis fermentans DSM 9555 = JCM 21142]|uniref:Putative alpha-1,2-mannosidase n=2 Tax=Saccharicrinis fermentans TaxID=982 RepID=W7XU50_9BACT|nr:putative alpha-1,2-mannosidase [Saccharicrinis fermentans DSM 9555 = JCM 21142]
MMVNKLKYIVVLLMVFEVAAFCQNYTQYVNPFIGTTNFGTTNPGAIVPQAMVSVVPFNVTGSDLNKWDKDARWWSTPYSWDNQFLTGFSHVNLSGVGCPDLGVIMVMPTTGTVDANLKHYGSIMSGQRAEPGYYTCKLEKYNVKAEVTSTKRTGLSKFTFPKGESNIIIDLGNSLTNESGAYVKVVSDREVEGWRMTGNFCYHGNSERPVYFVARFNKPATSFGAFKKMPAMMGAEKDWSASSGKFKYYTQFLHPLAGDSIGAYFSFDTDAGESVMVQVGISYVSIANARQNLEYESNGFSFEKTRNEAREEWNNVLSKVRVEGGTEDQKTVFYTALYHMNIHPNIINDVNGQYPMMESYGIGEVKDRDRYTVFSLWDTYRNFHPLMSLLYPEKQLDMVRSMVDMYKEGGWLPKWELNSKETYTMNGDPSFPVITDTYLRGLTDFDVQTAYEAMLKSATTPQKDNKIRTNNDFYLQKGYVPFTEDYDNSVSIALELYLADWNLGVLANKLGYRKEGKRFISQSKGYKNYFDKKTFKMLRPKKADGTFIADFDPLQGQNFEPVHGFHEGTAWQYTFGVPHDINGLIKLNGGGKQFAKKLQDIFDHQLFDMANEPDMHYPFLFNYVKGQEWRAQKEVQRLLDTYFKNEPGGIPGNDDCGTMSAWVAYSMMGFYPVCPGDMNYTITKPVFDKVTIELDARFYADSTFQIIKHSGADKEYIKSIRWNGQAVKSFFIHHDRVVNGGKLEIHMGEKE